MDVALDKHTRRGQSMGRGSKHFFEEGCLVFPQLEVDNDYRERYGRFLRNMTPKMLLRMPLFIIQVSIKELFRQLFFERRVYEGF